MLTLWVLLLRSTLAIAGGHELIEKMEGAWVGQGYRTLHLSGQVVQIETTVHAERRGMLLESRNSYRERMPSGAQREFSRTYFMDCRGADRCDLVYTSGREEIRVPALYDEQAGLHITQVVDFGGGESRSPAGPGFRVQTGRSTSRRLSIGAA